MLPNFRQINLQLNFSSLWYITREMRPNFWGEHFSGSHFRGEFFGLLILQIKCPKLLGEMRFKFPKFVSLESSRFLYMTGEMLPNFWRLFCLALKFADLVSKPGGNAAQFSKMFARVDFSSFWCAAGEHFSGSIFLEEFFRFSTGQL